MEGLKAVIAAAEATTIAYDGNAAAVVRLKVKAMESNKNASLQQILSDYKMPVAKHNELAILNGLELNEMTEKGTMIKVFGGQF